MRMIESEKPVPAAVEGEADAALPRPVQEHLARQLRAEYHIGEDKPAFLGDPALPPLFDGPLHRLAEKEREKIHERGVEAVEEALSDLIDVPERAPER